MTAREPWFEAHEPGRAAPRECVRAARDALDRSYGHIDRAPIPLLIEALDWMRRALEQMAPEVGNSHSRPPESTSETPHPSRGAED